MGWPEETPRVMWPVPRWVFAGLSRLRIAPRFRPISPRQGSSLPAGQNSLPAEGETDADAEAVEGRPDRAEAIAEAGEALAAE